MNWKGRNRPLSVWVKKGIIGYGNLLYPVINRWRSYKHPEGPCGKIPFYISFDLDYSKDIQSLPALLRVLAAHNVKASFACIGKWIEKYPEEHRALIAEGHEIFNHTYSHPDNDEINPYSFYTALTPEEQFDEIRKMQEVCEQMLQYKPIGFRLPHFGTVVEVDMPNLFRQLKTLGMLYDTSLLKFNIPRGKPDIYDAGFGITEFSINTCPYHPYAACDSWHIFRSDQWVYRSVHPFKTFETTFQEMVTTCFNRQEIINIYLDPMDMVQNDRLARLFEFAKPYCDFKRYRDFFSSSDCGDGHSGGTPATLWPVTRQKSFTSPWTMLCRKRPTRQDGDQREPWPRSARRHPRLPLVAVEALTSVVLPNTTCSVVSLPPVGGMW